MRMSLECVWDMYGISGQTSCLLTDREAERLNIPGLVLLCSRMSKAAQATCNHPAFILHPSCNDPGYWSIRRPGMGHSSLGVEGAFDGETTPIKNMGVNHGGFDILVPEKLLYRSDIVAVFKEVGGEGMAKGVRADRLVDPGESGCLSDCLLQGRLVPMMALLESTDRVNGEIVGGKDILPGKLAVGIGVFACQGIGKVDGSKALREIKLVLGFDLLIMEAQGLE